jgi:homopolymeric O-antigen transport system ATP-binding protein
LRPIIQIENLGKRYRIGGKRQPYLSLRDEITRKVRQYSSVLSRNQSQVSSSETDFWALKDVSFSVQPGEAVGIIGRNGAGKSTLLKILSQITPPTKGSITMRGRVASLLEVGTGFHPELTGRENIYLNGAILGMSRREIRRKFDEIVAFSEVEDFIDTPVKRYSSGMYVKLAFAVAAHLEPEILVVDEVLAVGDLAFQEKCLGKMGDISRGGRTVLFVSHNMASITNLCRKAIWLDDGWLKMSGKVNEVVNSYVGSVRSLPTRLLEGRTDRIGNGSVRFVAVEYRNGCGERVESVCLGDDLVVELVYRSESEKNLGALSVSIIFYNEMGVAVFCCWNDVVGARMRGLAPSGRLICRIDRLPLTPGIYSLALVLVVEGKAADKIRDAATLRVIEADFFEHGKLPPSQFGCVMVRHKWSSAPEKSAVGPSEEP